MKKKKVKEPRCPGCRKKKIVWHRQARWMCNACWRTYPAVTIVKYNKGMTLEELELFKEI